MPAKGSLNFIQKARRRLTAKLNRVEIRPNRTAGDARNHKNAVFFKIQRSCAKKTTPGAGQLK
jgi:hypothetical protein